MSDQEQIGPTIVYAGPAGERPAELPERGGAIEPSGGEAPAQPSPPQAQDVSPGSEWRPPTAGDEIRDSKGRVLRLRDLTFLQQMDLSALAGKERAGNENWMLMITLLARVDSIDGVPQKFPVNEIQLRLMQQTVDNEGAQALIERFNPPEDFNPEDRLGQAKN